MLFLYYDMYLKIDIKSNQININLFLINYLIKIRYSVKDMKLMELYFYQFDDLEGGMLHAWLLI